MGLHLTECVQATWKWRHFEKHYFCYAMLSVIALIISQDVLRGTQTMPATVSKLMLISNWVYNSNYHVSKDLINLKKKKIKKIICAIWRKANKTFVSTESVFHFQRGKIYQAPDLPLPSIWDLLLSWCFLLHLYNKQHCPNKILWDKSCSNSGKV